MPRTSLFSSELSTLRVSAHELQRAAGHLQSHAAGVDYIPTLRIALAHLEEAFDRLSVAALQMANGVTEWHAEPGMRADEDPLPPQAGALCFHLRSLAHGRPSATF